MALLTKNSFCSFSSSCSGPQLSHLLDGKTELWLHLQRSLRRSNEMMNVKRISTHVGPWVVSFPWDGCVTDLWIWASIYWTLILWKKVPNYWDYWLSSNSGFPVLTLLLSARLTCKLDWLMYEMNNIRWRLIREVHRLKWPVGPGWEMTTPSFPSSSPGPNSGAFSKM